MSAEDAEIYLSLMLLGECGEMQAWGQREWLVRTKLGPPPLRSDLIPRARLLDALREALCSHRLTLLSAPAGYGKTTLLSALAHTTSQPPLCWLSLDEGDNDPILFLSYIFAALQAINPACGETAYAVLRESAFPLPPLKRILGLWINEIVEAIPHTFGLLLDDLHLITEPQVYALLDYLLEHMPPQMHLAIATRYDPPLSLARLRAQGELAEFRVADLRFTLEETTSFLNDKLRLGLSREDLSSLQSRAEGWAAGLRLLANSLERLPTPAEQSEFIARFAHTDRYVFDFLAQEVLDRQDEEVRTFLLETSILSELTAPLCDAVTGRRDARSILDELDHRNLFVVALDEARTVFRYHAIFAEFLRQRLRQEMPRRVAELHRRAAQALMDSSPHRAISHYLAAEMWEEAAELIEQVGPGCIAQGLWNTLEDWICALPPEIRMSHPRLLYLQGVCVWQRGNPYAAQPLLEQALRGFEDAGDEAGRGETLVNLAICALLQADWERVQTLSSQALACPLSPQSRVQVLMTRAAQAILQENWPQAEADFNEAFSLVEESGDPELQSVFALHCSPVFALLPRGPERIGQVCAQVATLLGDTPSLSRVIVEGTLVFLHLWRGKLDEGIELGERALRFSQRLGGTPYLDVDVAATLAVAYTLRGDDAAADRCFEILFAQAEQLGLDGAFMAGYLYLLGRTRWLQGHLEEAREVYARMLSLRRPDELPLAPLLREMMRGLLEMAAGRYAVAEEIFRRAVAMEQHVRTAALFGSARLLLAYLLLKRNRLREALAQFEPLLAACAREGIPGPILKEGALAIPLLRLAVAHGVYAALASRILSILGVEERREGIPVPGTGEALTPRELEVLRLLAAGASNRAIAERLFISQNTVKTHVARILRKLDASSRTEAVARARELGIL
ncbi:MAG: hypothetical protein DRI80_10190 [Chloroflexota bacterium]|nr:MAG: hypothetical protein DRI80_10190 [Chloroflexota bacterium]